MSGNMSKSNDSVDAGHRTDEGRSRAADATCGDARLPWLGVVVAEDCSKKAFVIGGGASAGFALEDLRDFLIPCFELSDSELSWSH
jgi:hypothetical protein